MYYFKVSLAFRLNLAESFDKINKLVQVEVKMSKISESFARNLNIF